MIGRFNKFMLIVGLLVIFSSALSTKGPQSKSIRSLPFRTVKFLGESIFFTTQNGRYFGYLNTLERGQIETIYALEEGERIMDEFTTSDKLIIGNKNKSLVYFEPVSRTFAYDDRFVNQNFNELKGFKEINHKAYVITEDHVRYYKQSSEGVWTFEKQLISQKTLNPGIVEYYYDLYFFPTKRFPDRVILLTTAVFEKKEDEESDKLLSCFKWFEGEAQEVDGKCIIEDRLDIQDFRVTGRWAYLRMPTETYVYDETLTMKTKWQQTPTQYVAGHAVTSDQLTYLFKTNELVYYRLVQNFQNDDIKITINEDNFFISKKNKKLIKLTQPAQSQIIGAWLLELDENTFKTLIQFNTGDLHCYKIKRSEASTEINYLFRLAPEADLPVQNTNEQATQTSQEGKEEKGEEILAIAPGDTPQQTSDL